METVEIQKLSNIYAFGGDPVVATAVALAESSGNENAVNTNSNGTIDVGLWQINSVHKRTHPTWTEAWLKVPKNNAQAMGIVSAGGTNWQPWTKYRNGAYKAFLPDAQAARDDTHGSGGLGSIPNPLDVVDDVAGAITKLASAVGGFLTFLTDPNTWRRLALIALGGTVAVVGVAVIARGTEAGKAVEDAATSAAKVVT